MKSHDHCKQHRRQLYNSLATAKCERSWDMQEPQHSEWSRDPPWSFFGTPGYWLYPLICASHAPTWCLTAWNCPLIRSRLGCTKCLGWLESLESKTVESAQLYRAINLIVITNWRNTSDDQIFPPVFREALATVGCGHFTAHSSSRDLRVWYGFKTYPRIWFQNISRDSKAHKLPRNFLLVNLPGQSSRNCGMWTA